MPAAALELVHLASESLRTAIAPHLGAGIASLEANIGGRWLPLLRAGSENPQQFGDLGAFWMIPWCNRITGGRFMWRGASHELGTNWSDGPIRSAIHAIGAAREWTIIDAATDTVSCRLRWTPGPRTDGALTWPWRFTAEVRYTLAERALRADLVIINDDDSAMPLGMGLHPFVWRDPTGGGADCRLFAETRGRMEAHNLIPTGHVLDDELTGALRAAHFLGDAGADHVFEGFAGLARISWDHLETSLEIRCAAPFTRLHLFTRSPADEWATTYTRRHPFIAVEPVTQGPDAFSRDEAGCALPGEAICLGPGQRVETSITFRVV